MTVVAWVPVGLVVLAEALWLFVLHDLLQAIAGRPAVLSVPVVATLVLLGLLAVRAAGRRAGRWWPPLGLAFAVAVAALGTVAAAAAVGGSSRSAAEILAAAPGGWIAGLAVLRGYAHARLPLSEGTLGRLVAIGVPGLAVLAIVGNLLTEPARTRFLGDAFGAAIAFVAVGVLALTLTRLAIVGAGALDWRRNPVWLAATVAVLAVAIAAALPLSVVAGPAIGALVAIALGPMLVAGLAMGLDRTGRRALTFMIVALLVVYAILLLSGGNGGGPNPPPPGAGTEVPPTPTNDVFTISLGALLIAAAVIAVLLLAALWLRRAPLSEDDLVAETRTIDRGTDVPARRPWSRRLRGRPTPTDAAAAYLALVDDLAADDWLRRADAETPAEHAARLRAQRRGDVRLDLLAADYGLARFGGVDLTRREHRRAIGRWRALRRVLLRPADGDADGRR